MLIPQVFIVCSLISCRHNLPCSYTCTCSLDNISRKVGFLFFRLGFNPQQSHCLLRCSIYPIKLLQALRSSSDSVSSSLVNAIAVCRSLLLPLVVVVIAAPAAAVIVLSGKN
jgi:hypothetical protein